MPNTDEVIRKVAEDTGILEIKIKNGEVAEHPAWEDLILLENLEAGIVLINRDIKSIQESS